MKPHDSAKRFDETGECFGQGKNFPGVIVGYRHGKTDEFGKSVRDYEMISAFSVQASVPRTTAQGIEFAFGNITVVSAGRIDDDGVFFLFHHFFSAGKTVVHVNLVGVYFENEAVAETGQPTADFVAEFIIGGQGVFRFDFSLENLS